MEKKTDESVKTGLQVEGDNDTQNQQATELNEDLSKETDEDELVHEQADEEVIVNLDEEQDEDELVHSSNHVPKMDAESNHEIDPDDFIHQK